MKITAVDPIVLRIPFQDGGTGLGMTPLRWAVLDTVLVRIETDTGLVGWGEAFGYFCHRAVAPRLASCSFTFSDWSALTTSALS